MLNNIDPAQFEKGFEAGLNKMAYSWNDFKFNVNHPLTSLKSYVTDIPAKADGSGLDMNKFVNDHASGAGESFANGAISGLQKRIGYDPSKGLSDNLAGMTGWDKSKGYGDNLAGMVTNHPLMTAGLGAAGLYGGYQLGKGLGLWGGDNNNNGGGQQTNGDNNTLGPAPSPKNGFSAAYTTGAPKAPQALQKAGSSFNVSDGVRMNVSDLTLPRAFSAPTAIGMNLVNMMADDAPAAQQEQPDSAVNIAGQDAKAKELLAHPKMKAYIANLLQRTYQ